MPDAYVDPTGAPPAAQQAQENDSAYGRDFSAMMTMELLESETVQIPRREQLAAHYAAYRLSADLEELPFDEHVRLPLTRSATDDCVARYAGPFVMDRNPITVGAVEGTDPENAVANQSLLNQQYNDRRLLNGRMTLIKAAKLIYFTGSCYVFCDWVQEKRMRFGIGMLKDEMLDMDGPRWRIIHPYDVYPDPRADSVLTMRYLWVREEVSVKEFRRRVASGMYPKATKEAVDATIRTAGIQSGLVAGLSTEDKFSLPLAAGTPAPNQADSIMEPEGDRPIYLFHRFDRDKWCTASVTQDLLREVPNPAPDGEIPIRLGITNPDLQGPNGIPGAEASHGMNKNANRVASAYLEVVDRAGTPTILLKEGGQDLVQQSDLTGGMYDILIVRDPNDFKPMEKGSESAQVNLQAVDFFKFHSEVGSHSTDFRRGQSAAGAPGTATGTNAFQEQADTQFKLPFALFSDFVNELVALTALYNQTFLEKSQWVKRIGRQGTSVRTYEVNRPMLQGEFEYGTTATTSQGDPQAAQGISALMAQFGAIPGLLNVPYLARLFAKAVRVPNPDKAVPAYVPDPISVEDAIDMVKIGLPVPPNPADDPMEFADAFAAAAMQAMDAGDMQAAQLLAQEARKRMAMLGQLTGMPPGPGQDMGNPDGSKASDKGRPVPGGGNVIPGPGSMPGMAPGPLAPPGRDLRKAGAQ